jgi:tRNA pseudouridine38-40 synthase
MRYRVDCAFLGYHYHGWQIQDDVVTLQHVFQEVLSDIFQHDVSVVGCSRTDAKVSAEHFVFHFDGETTIPVDNLKTMLNHQLPDDIIVAELVMVNQNFHARKDARFKTYRYTIETGPYNVFEKHYVYQFNKHLDAYAMRTALDVFYGTHDFTSFNATPLQVIENQVRTMHHVDLIQKGTKIIITICGDGFLHHMVRMMVGTLIEIGRERLTIAEVKSMMDAKQKGVCRFNAPPQGLLLEGVHYED